MASKIAIIIEREYKTRVMKRSFVLMTLLMPLFFILITALPTVLLLWGGEDRQTIAVMDRTGLYGDVLQSTDKYDFVVADKPVDMYRAEGKDAGVSGLLVITQDLREDAKALTLFSFSTLPPSLEQYINERLSEYVSRQKLLSHNIEGIEEIIAHSQTRIQVDTYKFSEDGAETASSGTLSYALGLILAMASYMFISMYGGAVMQSVMEEKKSRIMEVMVSSVRPFDLMMGKIIGVGLVGLTQIFIWMILLTLLMQGGTFLLAGVASGTDTLLPTASAQDQADITALLSTLSSVNFLEIIVCFALYFVGGFLLYASIYAGLGSAISSDEDAQTVMWPVMLLMLVAFYTGFACAESPESTLAQVASYIPFTSPVVMMIRIPYGVALWEEVLSLVILYLSFTLMVYLGARIYRVGVLMYGKKPTLREIARWMLQGA